MNTLSIEDQDDFTNRMCENHKCKKEFDLTEPHYYDEEDDVCYCCKECFEEEEEEEHDTKCEKCQQPTVDIEDRLCHCCYHKTCAEGDCWCNCFCDD